MWEITRSGGRRIEDNDYPGRVQYPREMTVLATDFNRIVERFGELSVAHPYGILSRRAHRWLREQNVKGWEAEPVVRVE